MRFPRALTIGAGVAAGAIAYTKIVRPRYLRWGALPEDETRHWPGDDFLRCKALCASATRAVTIHAPAEAIWPWILQIGQDRAGFYSYSWLENLFGAEMRNMDYIVPEFQERHVGDRVWLATPDHYQGKAYCVVAMVEPHHAITLVSPSDWERLERGELAVEGSWAFLLDAVDGGTTRLVVRTRTGERTGIGWAAQYLFWEPAHFVMERRMMLRIKQLAEAEARRRETQHAPAATAAPH